MSDNNQQHNDPQASSLGAYVDSAVGAVQSAIGSLTGNTVDQAKGEQKQNHAEAEKQLSDTAVKAGPFTMSSSGAIAQDSKDRTDGSWNQTMGAAKEAVGGFIGNESLKQAGVKQNQEGKQQEAQGQLNDLGAGISDRVAGSVGGAVAALTGDRAEQEKRAAQHDVGKSLQRGVEADLQKSANAESK